MAVIYVGLFPFDYLPDKLLFCREGVKGPENVYIFGNIPFLV